MAKLQINPNKIVVFTGAGISVESGIPTFRFGEDALWANHDVDEVATRGAFKRNPEKVIRFFNDRKVEMLKAKPNAAHKAIAELENHYEVVVITTNLDNLHEQAGSTNVIHVHGNTMTARSSVDDSYVFYMGDDPIEMGMLCKHGEQLRPDIVLFDEPVHLKLQAQQELKDAAKVLIVGSSLSVKPISTIFKAARGNAEKIIVAPDFVNRPFGFKHIYAKATEYVPQVCERWIKQR